MNIPRMFFRTLSIILFGTFLSCSPPPTEAPNKIQTQNPEVLPGFIHTVFFWMKDDISLKERSFFEEGLEKLSEIESIQKVYWGPPAMTPRDVVDNSYDYAFIVHFKDAHAHDAYQVDQIHLDFIEASKHLWEDVQVYDNLVR